MTKYLGSGAFSSGANSRAYVDNWERTFGEADREIALNEYGGSDYTYDEMRRATTLCYDSQEATELAEMVEQLLDEGP